MKTKKAWSIVGIILAFIAITLLVILNLAFKTSGDIVLVQRNATITVAYGKTKLFSFISSLSSLGLVLLFSILSYVFTRSKNSDKHTVMWTYIITIIFITIDLIFGIFLLKGFYEFLNIGDAKIDWVPSKTVEGGFVVPKNDLTNTTNAYSNMQMKSILLIAVYFLYLWILIGASIGLNYTIKVKKGIVI